MQFRRIIISLFVLFTGNPAIAQSGIDTVFTFNIGGIKQAIAVKGKDRQKPLLLYLHGASGNKFSLIGNAEKLASKLQDRFLVALWDQRNYGKTLELNTSPQPSTVRLIESDAVAVADSLLNRFNRKKLFVAAHSMGCVMGMHLAKKYPGKIYALIAMSPPVDGVSSQRLRLNMLKDHYQKENNLEAMNDLSVIKLPAKDFESLFTLFIWQSDYDGQHIPDSLRAQLKPMLQDWMKTPAASLSDEVFEMNFFKEFPAVECPVYFFVGRKDFMTNHTITEKYYKKLNAPVKELFWFEQSGHNLPDSETGLMQDIIINRILPAMIK